MRKRSLSEKKNEEGNENKCTNIQSICKKVHMCLLAMKSIRIILRMRWISAVKVARAKGWVGQTGDLSNSSPTLVGGGNWYVLSQGTPVSSEHK